jgi:hypothetical protein
MSRGKRFFLIGLLCAAAMTALFLHFRREVGDPLTRELLDTARARWAANAPADYAFDVVVSGTQRGLYHVEVRGGQVTAMTSDGAPVDGRARELWTMDGLFGFLATELGNLERVEAAYGVRDKDDVVLRAAFDPRYGYPVRFLRHVLGTSRSVEWEVRFSAGG